jgi:hypothetical protein
MRRSDCTASLKLAQWHFFDGSLPWMRRVWNEWISWRHARYPSNFRGSKAWQYVQLYQQVNKDVICELCQDVHDTMLGIGGRSNIWQFFIFLTSTWSIKQDALLHLVTEFINKIEAYSHCDSKSLPKFDNIGAESKSMQFFYVHNMKLVALMTGITQATGCVWL